MVATSTSPTEASTLTVTKTPWYDSLTEPAAVGTVVVPPALAVDPSSAVTAMPSPIPTPAPKTAFRVNIPDRYTNIVLLGSDRRAKSRAWRTDTMIVLSLDTEDNVVRLLSIPRDLWVYIPRHGYNRVNTAELWGELAKRGTGTERVKQTIHHNLGIPIHYYARVDMQGFMKIIDTIGGLNIDVDCPLPDIKLKPGMYHMNGNEALRYARSRKSTSDFDRGRRQRKVLMALWDQALTPDVVPRLPMLWLAMADTFDTDLPLDLVVNLAYMGLQLQPQDILSKAIDRKVVKSWRTPQGAAVLLPQEAKMRAMLEAFYAPGNPAQLEAADKVRVQVLSGAQRRDAEKLAAAVLRWEGFEVVDTGKADRQDYVGTRINVYTGDPAAGERIARQLKVPLSAVHDLTGNEAPPNLPNPADIQVILGKDYDPCQK